MLTLTYGRQKPQTNDRGSDFFPALEANIVLDDAHDHDGTDSALLPASSITRFTSTITSGQWSGSAGVYTKQVTVPIGISGAATYNDVNDYSLDFYITSSGTRVLPTVVRDSSDKFTVTVNDNSLNLSIIYS